MLVTSLVMAADAVSLLPRRRRDSARPRGSCDCRRGSPRGRNGAKESARPRGSSLSGPEVRDYCAWLVASAIPKSYVQAGYETEVTADVFKNGGGDNWAVAWARGAAVALPRAAPGLREQPLRCRELRLRSWSCRCAERPGMLIAISSTAILRRLQGRDADEGRDGRVLLELLTLLVKLLAPGSSLQP